MSPINSRGWLLLVFQLIGSIAGEKDKLLDCGKPIVCAGRDPKHDMKFHPKPGVKSSCFCDKQCSLFEDCCIDKASNPKSRLMKKSLSCVRISFNQSIYAVSSCYHNKDPWKRKCEKNVPPEEYHYTMDIPVYSKLSGLYYANIYCAYCHKQLTSVQKPALSINCTNDVTIEKLLGIGQYQRGKLTWKVGNGFCRIFSSTEITDGRPCFNAISNCPADSEAVDSAMCNAYSSVVLASNKLYRNPHCAICNGIKSSNLSCWQQARKKALPSVSTILGFDWNFSSCDLPETVWDSLHQKCILVDCSVINSSENNSCYNVSSGELSFYRLQDELIMDGYITFVSFSASVICLLIHMIMSAVLHKHKNNPEKILNSLAFSLMTAQVLFLFGIHPFISVKDSVCYGIAVLEQFFFLATFFWMNAISIDICYTFSNASLKNNNKASEKNNKKYFIYAWGGATFISTFSITADLTTMIPFIYRPRFAARHNICWFGSRRGLAIFFYFPMMFLLLLNTILFIITICWFQKQHTSSDLLNASGRIEYNRPLLYLKLSTIMGTSWAFGMSTYMTNRTFYHYPFTLLNGLQGVFIFIMFDFKIVRILTFFNNISSVFRKKLQKKDPIIYTVT